MCPCPICATIAILLLPFAGYKWAKKFLKKHHCSCDRCQEAEQNQHNEGHTACHCHTCKRKGNKK